jgi:ElaA protein
LADALHWSWLAWDDLTLDDLYDALALRCRVFVLEQGPYLDPDGLDRVSHHLLGRDADGTLQAVLRMVHAGHKYAEPSMGRVVTSLEWRGRGAGRALVAEGLRRLLAQWPGAACRISAQAHLERFYAGFGFAAVGEPYLEDGIPHLEMLRPAALAAPIGDDTT